MITRFRQLTLCAVMHAAAFHSPQRVTAAASIDYGRQIQPLLARHCFACHGPDEHDRKAGLRLDSRDAATAEREAGRAIVPHHPKSSVLVQRIDHADPEERMPPADTGKPLSEEQKQLIRDWIVQGASYSRHWAFQRPTAELPPSVQQRNADVRNPLDNFVLRKLRLPALPQAPAADRVTLLRRLCLDLVGLPPTPEEIDAFVRDQSPLAYEKQIDRLLKSRHFGERWGRLWLDAARYADTDGYEKDKPRTVWFYRDWVINAFNRDQPYNEFIIEQIAGDLLRKPTQDQMVATGFLRNSMLNEEGGIDPEQFRMEAMFDRMDTIGKSILGLTVQCAQCHDHKYDPFTQKEYYQLFAFLNNDHEAMPVVYTPAQRRTVKRLRGAIVREEAALRQLNPDWRKQITAWEKSLPRTEWTPLDIINIGNNAQRYSRMKDHSLLAGGWAPTRFTATFAHTNGLENITGLRIELLTDPNLPGYGPGRGFDGNFALSEIKVQIATTATPEKKSRVVITRAASDFAQPASVLPARFTDGTTNRRVTGPVSYAIDNDNKTAWSADRGPGRRNTPTVAVFEFEKPVGSKSGNVLYLDLVQMHGGKNGNDFVTKNFGRFRVSVTTATNLTTKPVPPQIRNILKRPPARRTNRQWNQLFSYWRTTIPAFKAANQRIEKIWRNWPEGTTTYVLKARTGRRPTTILKRGDWLQPGAEVKAAIPAFLNRLEGDFPPTRLTLARWLASDNAPTTARVFVNRVWQACFGRGLVSTPEDFGVQGEPPTHPELLDWLAVDFMASGWSVKHLIKRVVNSATYRQSSRVTPELLAKDPDNRLLARGSRFRVDAEIVRDITLAASGLLNPKMGGPGVMVPAPGFLFEPPASYGDFPWQNETGPDRYRRAVYTYRRRSTPFPALTVFDAPPGDFSCVRRPRSNTPLQALTTLNEPLFVEAAQALARKTLKEGGRTDRQRLDYAFRRCLGRQPEGFETETLLSLLEQESDRFKADMEAARLFAGGKHGSEDLQLAAWTVVTRVLLNLDETITRE